MQAQPAKSFPMRIDPSFGKQGEISYQMFKSDGYSCGANNCYANIGTLDDGSGWWKSWRTYINFPYGELAGKKVINANLHGWFKYGINGITDGRGISMYHAPCVGYHCFGEYAGGAGASTDFDINFTDALSRRVKAGDFGAWWALAGEEGGYKSYKPYYDMRADIVYDTPTPVATPVEPADKQVTVNNQPTLRVNGVSDADGDAVQYYFRVSTSPDAETGAVINSGWIPTTQWTVPDGILQDGTTYYWHTYTLGTTQTDPNWVRSFKLDLRTGKDSTQAYDTVGPMGIDLATGNATTSASTHSMSALGGAIGLNMDYDSPVKTQKGLTGEYWNINSSHTFGAPPSGAPVLTRNDQDVNFSWPNGSSPSPGAINNDWFYARWKGYFVAPATGSYAFGGVADDGMIVNVNGQNFGACYGATPCYNGTPITLQAGQAVPIVVNYQEATGDGLARMYVKGPVPEQIIPRDWLQTEVKATTSQYGLAGRYYTDDGSHNFPANNSDPMRFMMARNDSKLSFNWGLGGPAPGLQTDNFMAKWTGYVTVPTTGAYTFGAGSDDGVRVKLNNGFAGSSQTVLDAWQDQSADVWGSATNLTAGQQVPITVEYYERGGGARMNLLVRGPGVSDQEIPVKWLTPKASALPDAWRLGVDVDGNIGYERLRVAGTNVILEDSTRATHEYTWTGSGYKPPVNEDGQLSRNADNTFTLIDSDGRTYVFDTEGKLKSLTSPTDDRTPASLKYEYSGDPSRLMKITDGVTSARYGTLHYKGVNEESNCAVPSGFDAAPDGMLCAFKTSDGDMTKLCYKAGQLSRIEKPGTDRTDYGYDSFGRIISMRDSTANDAIAASVRVDNAEVLTEVTYDSLGRASGIKAPAPSPGAARLNHTFEYAANATKMRIAGAPEPNGFSKRIEYDSLLRTTKETDVSNQSSVQEWDSVKDLQLSSTDATGLKSTTIYDDDDRAIENYGPAPSAWYGADRKPLAAQVNNVPRTTTGYDEGMTGLAVSVFDNAKLLRTPKLVTTGMTNVPYGSYGLSLTNTQVTPLDGLSLRATGKIRLDKLGVYSFKIWHGDGARVYIDDQLVNDDWANGGERFSAVGTYNNTQAGKRVRITIESYKNGTSGSGVGGRLFTSLNQLEPGSSIWTEAIGGQYSPAYNLTTSQTAYDSQLGNVTTKTTYANPAYGLATATTADPSGLNLQATATFETPGSGFLRQASRTLPGGTSTTYRYYGAADSIDNPCTVANDPAIQAGATKGKTETDPDGSGPKQPRTTEAIYNASGKVVATRFNNDSWTCITYDSRGRQISSIQPVVNGRPGRTITTQYAADGNPLKTRTIDSVVGTTESLVDILGRTVSTKDVWGNDYILTYDSYGNITQKTSPLGTETYIYDAFFRPTSYALNSTTYATLTYDSFGRMATVTYPQAKDTANNTLKLTQVKRDSIGRSAGVVYQTSDGKTFDETVVKSQLGKIMSATQSYDGQTLSSNFTYDSVGRLTSGTIGKTKFDYGYSVPDATACGANSTNNALSNKNSNRTSYKITNTITSAVVMDVKSCYNYADQLTYSTDTSIGTPVYDDHGNTISFSGNGVPLSFGYDANDNNILVTQGTKRTEYVKSATGDVLRKKEYDSGVLTSSYRYVAGGSILQTCLLTDANNCTTLDRYLTLPGNVSLSLSPTNPDTTKRAVYSLRNYHGDTALTLTNEGKTTASTNTLLAYGPFGEQLIAGTLGTTTVNNLNATDKTMGWAANPARKQDSRYTTSFIQMGARVYIPSLGRFLQVDPVDGGTLNGYVYVADPINSSDYSGRWGIGNLFSAIVKVVKAVVKAIITPIAAVARTAWSYVSQPKAAASGGGRTGTSATTGRGQSIMTNPSTKRDYFEIQSTQPKSSNTYKPVSFSLSAVNFKSLLPPAGYSPRGFGVAVGGGCTTTGLLFMGIVGLPGALATAGTSIPAAAGAGCASGVVGGVITYLLIGDATVQDTSAAGDAYSELMNRYR